jgi:predicted nuclease of predicted toxin-antitoxin system
MAGRLLLDENLSPRLAPELSGQFPGSVHVRDVQLSLLRGAPPKVIWLVVGNTSTAEILRILLAHATAIEAFITEPITSLLTLRKP